MDRALRVDNDTLSRLLGPDIRRLMLVLVEKRGDDRWFKKAETGILMTTFAFVHEFGFAYPAPKASTKREIKKGATLLPALSTAGAALPIMII